MTIESLQSQIKALRARTIDLSGRDDQVESHDYHALIKSLDEMSSSVAEELKKAQLEIEAERQSYQNLFRFAQEGYFVTDRDGIIREANTIGGILLGMQEGELIGKTLASYVRAEERPAFHLHMACLNEFKNFHTWETVFIRHTKQELDAAITVSIICDDQGNLSGLRWLVHDITKHRQVEERLRRNTGQLIEAQQIGHVGSWEWDIERNEVAWSDEMYRIYGLEPQSVKMTYEGYLAFLHPEDHAQVSTAIENSFKTHQPFSFDHRILQSDGAIRYLHAQGIVLLNDSNQPVRMIGTGQDITQQKQAEEQLRHLNFELEQRVENRTQELLAANERLVNIVVERKRNEESIQQLNRELNRRVAELQTVLNVLPVGISVAYDPRAVHIMTNSTGQQIMRISQNENSPLNDPAVEAPPYKIMRDGREIPLEERPMQVAIKHNVFVSDAEIDLLYDDGMRQNLLAYASPLYDEEYQVRGGVAAFIDITKRKTIERRLALQYAVARALAESEGISEASLKVVEIISKEMGWEFGVFWIFDRHANQLYVENIWQKQGMPDNELAEASRKLFPAPGEALPGSVYLANKPLWLSDHSDQPNFPRKEAAINSGFNSVVSFPLRRGEDEVLGVVEFFSHYIQPATPDLIDMFDAFASQVGEFMGRKYAEDLRATQMQQQAVITKLSQRALLGADLQELLNEACTLISQTLSVDFCNELEYFPEKQQMLFRAGEGWGEEVIGRSYLDFGPDSQIAYVLSQKQPVNILELSKETRFQAAPILADREIVSGMSVVISGRSQPFGLLEAYSKKRRIFTQDDIHFLQGVAHVLAAAIQHQEVEKALRLSRNQLSVILGGIADGITAQSTNGQLIYANDTAAHIIGYANADELINAPLNRITSMFEIFDEAGAAMSLDQLPGRLALRGEVSSPMTIRFKVLKTGEERWSVVKAQAVMNEMGQVMMAVNIFHDITDLKRTELEQRLLAETSQVLAKDLDYKTRLTNLAKLLVPRLADWCAIDIVDENQEIQRVAVAHTDPKMIEWAYEINRRYPPGPNSSTGVYKVIRTHQAEYVPVIPAEMIDAITDPDQREHVRKLGLASLIVVPLSARGHTLGALSLIWAESNHRYTTDDLELTQELARRAGLALDNARLYAEAQRLNTELEERVNMRTAQLQSSNVRLSDEVNERKMVEEKFRRLNVELEERVVERTRQLENANQKLQVEIFERELTDEALRLSLQKTRELYEISQTMGLVNTPDELLQALLSSSYLVSAIRASIAVFDSIWHEEEVPPAFCKILTAWNQQSNTLLYIGQKMTSMEYGLLEPYSRNEPLVIADIRHDPRINEAMRQRLMNLDVVSSIIFPLIAGGECYGMLSLHFDQVIMLNTEDLRHLQGLVDEVAMGIHNFRLLEAEARARREAEEANDVKLKFLAMISHELRTPLTSIKGFSTTLLADDVEWTPENQRDFIETISLEADKLSELIEQLLNLSRLEAGAIRIDPQHVEWKQILLTSLAQLQALTIHHHLVMEEQEALPTLNVDVMRVSQVVTNLVTNATRYSPHNTTIMIAVEKLSDQFIKVRVIDEGTGIPWQERSRVFEAFQQLDREKAGTQGAGLGLAICRGLIEAHGGRIWVDNHTGQGTTMSFTLPIAD